MGALLVKLLAPQFQAILIDSAQSLQLQADIAMQASGAGRVLVSGSQKRCDLVGLLTPELL